MKPITKQEAEEFNRENLASVTHEAALEEAIDKINKSILINWESVKQGNFVTSQPLNNCIDYTRLMIALKELYSKEGFDIYWGKASCVLMIQLTPPKIEVVKDETAALKSI